MTHKAVYVPPGGGLTQLQMGTTDAAPPQAGEITVRLHASSLNYHDYLVVSGMMKHDTPRIPMSDGAGEVVAIGAGVTEFAVGDAVVSTFFPQWTSGKTNDIGFVHTPGDGIDGYAREMVTVGTNAFTLAPKGYSHAEASTLTTAGLTAWRALVCDGAIKPGDNVLVQGTGGLAIFSTQFAKMAGANVIVISSSDDKLARMKELGADHLINYRTTPQWGEAVLAATQGKGAHHIIEVGGPATLPQSMIAAAIGANIFIIGAFGGRTAEFSIGMVLYKQLQLRGLLVGTRQQQQDMITAINSNGIRPVLDRTFTLATLAEAFQYQETNQHFGKITLTI